MNKITHKIPSTLAGLALVATAGIAPALAQGTFTYAGGPTPFTFRTDGPGTAITLAPIPVIFNPTTVGGSTTTGTLALTGGTFAFGGPIAGTITGVTETFIPTVGPGFTDMGTIFISQRSATTYDIASDTTTFTTSGTSFDLVPGTPVPEASPTASLGLLLALGGIAVAAKRKKTSGKAAV